MSASTIDPPVKEPPVPQTPTRPNTPPPQEPDPPEPEPDDAQASSLTFGQRLNAAATALRGRGTSAEIEQLRGEMNALTTERDTLRTDLSAVRVALGVANAERDRAAKKLAEAEAAMADFEASVRTRSIEDCAAAGVPIGQLPVVGSEGEGAPQTKEQVEKALDGKSFEEKREILKAWHNRNRN
jgi:chromosome segregation ATPase